MSSSEDRIINLLNAITYTSIDTFADRLKLQKLAYLAREVGFDCGFAFDWYVRGPYSPSLTRALFAADEIGTLRQENIKLSEPEAKVVQRLKNLMGQEIQEPLSLELVASVWYVLPPGDLSTEEKKRIIDFLSEEKPHFTREQFEATIRRIQEFRKRL